MLHELRIYRCLPGKLPALLKRFESTTLKLWEKHGIRHAGFWTVQVGENSNDLYYLLEWDNLAEREQRWNAFAADPEWAREKAESEQHGPVVASISNQILNPVPFAPPPRVARG